MARLVRNHVLETEALIGPAKGNVVLSFRISLAPSESRLLFPVKTDHPLLCQKRIIVTRNAAHKEIFI